MQKHPRPISKDSSLEEVVEWLETEVQHCAGVRGTKTLVDSLGVAAIHLRWAAGLPSVFDDEE